MISIIVCDDDKVFASELHKHIERAMNEKKIRARIMEFNSAEDMGSEIITTCDIAFLDIDFEGKKYNGIDIARRIREKRTDAVIVFVTNYIQYAPEGYEVQAFRYILKEDLPQKLISNLDQIIERLQTERTSIKIQCDGELTSIPTNDILFIEAAGHTLIIHTLTGKHGEEKVFITYTTMAKMEEELEKLGFLRIHKSYIVNMRHINTLKCNEATLTTGQTLSVGSRSYSECRKKYLLWRGKQ